MSDTFAKLSLAGPALFGLPEHSNHADVVQRVVPQTWRQRSHRASVLPRFLQPSALQNATRQYVDVEEPESGRPAIPARLLCIVRYAPPIHNPRDTHSSPSTSSSVV